MYTETIDCRDWYLPEVTGKDNLKIKLLCLYTMKIMLEVFFFFSYQTRETIPSDLFDHSQ